MPTALRELKIKRVASVDAGAGEGVKIMMMKRAPVDDTAYCELLKRTFTADERKAAEESGAAMPGGRYSIENKSDLENAIHAVGRGKGSHDAIRAHIIARAKALGASDMIPETWGKSGAVGKAVEFLKAAWKAAGGTDDAIEAAIAKADVSAILAEDTDDDIKMFADIIANSGLQQAIWDATSALSTSVNSIVCDDEVDAAGKLTLLQETSQEFTNHMLQLVGGALAKSSARTVNEGDGSQMSDALKKSLGLADTATDAEVTKALEDASFGVAVAKMSDKHTAFMNNPKAKLPSGGKKAFAAMEPGERDDHMDKNPIPSDDDGDETEKMLKSGDAFRSPEGVLIVKSKVGADVFAVMKSQNDRLATQADEIAKARDVQAIAEIAKRVAPLDSIAKADELGALLHAIGKHDPKAAEQVEALLKTANERIEKGELFAEKGSGAAGVIEATKAIDAQARELLKTDSAVKTIEKARTIIRDRNPDLAKQEQEETRKRAA